MKLYALFFQCLHIPYSNAGVSASYATRRESDTLYLYFQGSEGKNDWKNNLDFPSRRISE